MTNICVIGAGYVGLLTTASLGELPWYGRGKEPESGAGLGFTCEGAGSGTRSRVNGFPGNWDQRQDPFAAPKWENSYRVLTLHIHPSYQTENRMIDVTNGGNTTGEHRRTGSASSFHAPREENRYG